MDERKETVQQEPAPTPATRTETSPPTKMSLIIGAIGVVYGDIGTSPLYAMKEAFSGAHPMAANAQNVYGLLSVVFWTLVVIVSLKYAYLMMRADFKGQGGSLALLALVNQVTQRKNSKWLPTVSVILGIYAGALFYGDSMITPAISVLGAVEGLNVALPQLGDFIVPISVAILVALFFFQCRGVAVIGRFFGPIMCVWFVTIAASGIFNILQDPEVLFALSPWYAIKFFVADPHTAFLSLGAVILVVTGSEALYTDMGHFGKQPLRLSWSYFVLPCLTLNYFGQGALLLKTPEAAENPFFLMVPSWAAIPMLILATMAAVIASQAVISGAFSVTRQAMQLGYLPRMKTIHTSEHEISQIYIPFINWTLMFFVIVLVLGFQSSIALGHAYGVAVAGTMMIDTVQLTIVMFLLWRWNVWLSVVLSAFLLIYDALLLLANITKIPTGGWFPLVIGVSVFVLLTTWKKGRELLFRRLSEDAMPIESFLKSLNPNVTRVPGTSVFMSGVTAGVPHAMLHNLKHNRVIHDRVVFLTVVTEEVPHVPESERIEAEHLGRRFYRLLIRYGYLDENNIPEALKAASRLNLDFNEMETSFFLGRETIIPSKRPGMMLWREGLFAFMNRSATSAMNFFKLPPNRVIELGTQVEI